MPPFSVPLRTIRFAAGMVCAAIVFSLLPSTVYASCGDYLQSHPMRNVTNPSESFPETPRPLCRCEAGECRSLPVAPLPTEQSGWTRGLPQSAWWRSSRLMIATETDPPLRVSDEHFRQVAMVVIEHVPIV